MLVYFFSMVARLWPRRPFGAGSSVQKARYTHEFAHTAARSHACHHPVLVYTPVLLHNSSMPESDISILILAHNKAAYTRRCLESLPLSTLRPFHVALVDNGSTDDTPDVLDEFEKRAAAQQISVSRLRLEQNAGAIVGRNRGMELMRGKYWVFLDNDVVVRTRSWLERLRTVLENDPRIGVVGPKLVYALPPHDIQCAGCEVTRGGRVAFRGRGRPRLHPEFSSPRNCQTLISAAWMLRADVAQKIGPLDERFSPVQFEDIDYCYRIREAGYVCRYEPSVELYHFENVTTGRTGTLNYPYLTVKNGLKFKQKWAHCFEKENGPPDDAWSWANVATVSLEDVPANLETLP
ncbi:MAG TPA: glycosyltransferase family 2 protein [Planctomycetota bacterium]|jgi:GT2 family glycosyltransferase